MVRTPFRVASVVDTLKVGGEAAETLNGGVARARPDV
jgi:hypothetical protein